MKNKNLENLLKLIAENPDLPVIPFVDSQVVCEDDYPYWIASIGNSLVTEYCLVDEHYYLKKDIDDFNELVDRLQMEYDKFEECDLKIASNAEKMNWQKAICVYIDLPEE